MSPTPTTCSPFGLSCGGRLGIHDRTCAADAWHAALGSVTGPDEQLIQRWFGAPLAQLLTAEPVQAGRAVLFVLNCRAGMSDAGAFRAAHTESRVPDWVDAAGDLLRPVRTIFAAANAMQELAAFDQSAGASAAALFGDIDDQLVGVAADLADLAEGAVRALQSRRGRPLPQVKPRPIYAAFSSPIPRPSPPADAPAHREMHACTLVVKLVSAPNAPNGRPGAQA